MTDLDTPPADLRWPHDRAVEVVRGALAEDLGDTGTDVTTTATIPREQVRTAEVVARAAGVVAGLPVLETVFAEAAARLHVAAPEVTLLRVDGDRVARGEVLARVTGPTWAVLVAERTALNIVCRLSGIATHTAEWAERLEGTGAMVLDTRKTTPLLRALEKYAVRAGGGTNKRMGLFDVAMVKDNHKLAAGSVSAAYTAIRETYPDVDVQVEVTTTAEALEAVAVGARFLLCDNMSADLLAEAVDAVRATGEEVEIEATGGLTLDVVAEYAATGVDYLSVGALTHSSPILDVALDLAD